MLLFIVVVVLNKNGNVQVRFLLIRIKNLCGFFQVKKLPIVYDAHYSINELIKDVRCLRGADLRTCNTSLNDTDQLSLKIEQTRIEPTGLRLLFDFYFNKMFDFRSFISIII